LFTDLEIASPKRDRRRFSGWEGFSPYYAGYSEFFTNVILRSAKLYLGSTVFDPWNGSGTTTFVAANLGLRSIGYDINPVMVVVAKARMLAKSEADSIIPLGLQLLRQANSYQASEMSSDPIYNWFDLPTANHIRGIERSICGTLVGEMTLPGNGSDVSKMSNFASAMYLVLFAAARDLARPLRSSNPTWLKLPKSPDQKISASNVQVNAVFEKHLRSLTKAIAFDNRTSYLESKAFEITVADSTFYAPPAETVDFILTSPPYCTRIDYTAITRIQLAIMNPLLNDDINTLGKRMLGSTRVPATAPERSQMWGKTCSKFLDDVFCHNSKASSTYYYKSHLDYFEKLDSSIRNSGNTLKKKGRAVFVVQDSFYKNVHNNLQAIISEIAEGYGLSVLQRADFEIQRTLASSHPARQKYRSEIGATESVIVFEKN
jgi:tRNA G10  N-methylase Trm11